SIASGRGPVSSTRARAHLSAFFGWAIKKGIDLPKGNVAAHTEKRKENSRTRVLTDNELRAIWNACGDNGFRAVVKLLILTGQCKSEIGSLRWDEVRDEQIVLPGERTKNKHPHSVPLSDAAAAILDKLRVDGRRCVFGRGDSGLNGWNMAKRQ